MKTIDTPTSQVPAAKPQEMWLSKDGFEPVPERPVISQDADAAPSPANKIPAPDPATSGPSK